VELLRDVSGPIAEADTRVDDRAGHDREHDHGGHEHDPVEADDLLCFRPARVERPRPHRDED